MNEVDTLSVLRHARAIYAERGGAIADPIDHNGRVCLLGAIAETIAGEPNPPAIYFDDEILWVASQVAPCGERYPYLWHDKTVVHHGTGMVLAAFDAAIKRLETRLGYSDGHHIGAQDLFALHEWADVAEAEVRP